MNVRDEFDTTSDYTGVSFSPEFMDREGNPLKTSETRQYQYAWDKQANFLNAQSRAMTTLSNLIKQFLAIADEQDERRKKLELMDAQIAKLKSSLPDTDGSDSNITIVDAWSDDDG